MNFTDKNIELAVMGVWSQLRLRNGGHGVLPAESGGNMHLNQSLDVNLAILHCTVKDTPKGSYRMGKAKAHNK